MDPNETIRLIKDALAALRKAKDGDSNDVEIDAAHELAGYVDDLLEWLDKGGFKPCSHSS